MRAIGAWVGAECCEAPTLSPTPRTQLGADRGLSATGRLSGRSVRPADLLSYGLGQRHRRCPFLAACWAMLVILLIEAIPAIRYNGFGFFTSSTWSRATPTAPSSHAGGVYHLLDAHFGAWPLIAGTLESSAIALIVGFPIAVGAAVVLVEKLPARPAAAIGLCLEVLAGIPSAVIGIFGIFTFGPWVAQHIYPILTHMPNVPVLRSSTASPRATARAC